MKTNGTQSTRRTHEFKPPPFPDPPKPQPLAKVEQAANQAAAKLELIQQKQELDLQRTMGKAAVAQSMIPVIAATLGDPNHNLQQLANVINVRGCDIAEDCIEITIED